MATTLGKLFKDLAASAGLNTADDKYKAIIETDTEVPEEIGNLIKTNLMTIEAAKNNPTLKKHYHAQALNAVDTELKERVSEFGFDEADVTKFENEQSTFKRVGMIIKRAKELEIESAKGAGNSPEVEQLKTTLTQLKDKVKELNGSIVEKEGSYAAKIEAAKREASNAILDHTINAELLGKEYVNDKLDKAVNVTVAKTLLEKKLNEVGAMVIRDANGNIKLVHKDAPDMDYMVQNKEVKLGIFIDQTLGESNILKVTENLGDNRGGGKTKFDRIDNGGETKDIIPQEAADFYASQLNDYSQD
jgi:hypothetical protein